MRHALRTIALGPVLLSQGVWTRRRTPLLPEPPGPRQGTRPGTRSGTRPGAPGTPLRLLVLGDSAAAGVGADHQDQALLGQLLAALPAQRAVQFQLHASTGHRTTDTLARLDHVVGPVDVAVSSLGVNDVTGMTARRQFRAAQQALVEHLRDVLGARLVVLSGVPPMHAFPALPQPLRWYLGARARELDADLAAVAAHTGALHLPFPADPAPGDAAADGFHPGPQAYRTWARLVVDLLEPHLQTLP